MSKQRIVTKHVHLFNNGELVSLAPGDTVPDWAESLVTNPAVFAEAPTPDVVPDPAEGTNAASADEASDELDLLSHDDLKKTAGELGLSKRGSKDALKAAIRAKRAEGAPVAELAGRDALEARAKEQGVEFDENTTDEELETLLDGGQE